MNQDHLADTKKKEDWIDAGNAFYILKLQFPPLNDEVCDGLQVTPQRHRATGIVLPVLKEREKNG